MSKVLRSCVAAMAVPWVLVGCGAGTAEPAAATHAATENPTLAPDRNGGTAGTAGTPETPGRAGDADASQQEQVSGPSREPVLAATSLPAGLESWDEDERAKKQKACKPLMDAVARQATKDQERPDRTEAALHALEKPPNVPGVDREACVTFLRDQLLAYRARSIEAEAINHIKRIVVGLADATMGEPPRLCPSAPPVPKSLEAVREGPHQAPPSAWNVEGWNCVRFQLGGAPQRFQYELVTDPQAGRYEIIARGFPVPGHGPEVLFLAGETQDGRVTPSSQIMRR